jgi:SAM-dependent methyltransferase
VSGDATPGKTVRGGAAPGNTLVDGALADGARVGAAMVHGAGDALPLLYTDLAGWFHLLTRPEEYAEEALEYFGDIEAALGRRPATLLELGCGGGNNASYMKNWTQPTLTDVSPTMLAMSRRLNPDCEHIAGDMRELRLGRVFDAVFVHDAVCYMRSETDLRRAMETAFLHCRPGGAALFVPDDVRETFEPRTDCGGNDGAEGGPDAGRALRYLEWSWDPDPADSEALTDFAYLLRERDGSVRALRDRHVFGLFPRATWLGLLREVGFVAEPAPSEIGGAPFIARRPARA